jgi:hypothetical protein
MKAPSTLLDASSTKAIDATTNALDPTAVNHQPAPARH